MVTERRIAEWGIVLALLVLTAVIAAKPVGNRQRFIPMVSGNAPVWLRTVALDTQTGQSCFTHAVFQENELAVPLCVDLVAAKK